MKRNYISPEYSYAKVSGLLNMREQSTFFGSKMMEVPNIITIGNSNISYFQNDLGEQVNYDNEIIKPPIVIDMVSIKSKKHVMYMDTSVGSEGGQVSWVIEISLFDIFSSYVFGCIKKNRTFSGVLASDLLNNDVDLTIYDYITYNIVNLYNLKSIDLYVSYNNLLTGIGMINANKFNTNITGERVNISNMIFNSDRSIVKIYFKQTNDYTQFSFDYYFDFNFEKF